MEEEQAYKLKKFIKELETIRGRHTELVSVYVPSGFNLVETINMLREEHSLAQNVKDKAVRKNVMSALEKVIQYLKLYRQTPGNGLIVFCGNVSSQPGSSDIKLWSLEPPEKISAKIYRCDQVFILEPLKELVREKEVYGLIVLDAREADVGLLKGKAIEDLKHLDSTVPSKTVKGGMCTDPGTLVQLYDGRILRIDELTERDNPILCCDLNIFKTVDAIHNHIFRSKIHESVKIKTKAPGILISVSPNHRFFTFGENGIGLRYARDLKPNDNLLAVKRINIKTRLPKLNVQVQTNYKITRDGRKFLVKIRNKWSIPQHKIAKKLGVTQTTISKFELGERNLTIDKLRKLISLYGLNDKKFFKKFMKSTVSLKFPKIITLELCQLLGYMLGDGGKDVNRIILYDKDESLLNSYRNIVNTLFNINTGKRYRKREKSKKGSYELKIYSKELLTIINSIFGGILENPRKIPEIIQKLPKKYLARFISGLFDAEGFVEKKSIGIAMSDKQVIQMLQLLLLRFGIIGSYREELYKGKYMKYHIQISDFDSMRKFKKTINFLSKQKRITLNETLKKRTIRTYSDQIPVSGKFIIKLARELKMNTEYFPKVRNFFYDKERQSFRTFKKEVLKYFKIRLREIRNAKNNDLRKFRENVGLTLKEVGSRAGYTANTIWEFEKGKDKNKALNYEIEKALMAAQKELEFKIVNVIDLLYYIASGDVILTKVDKIEKMDTNDTFFDLTVPRYCNFVVNGIIVHNSQARYDRIREDALNEFFTKVGETASRLLLQQPDLKGVIIGGPGFTKNRFIDGGYLHYEIQKKIIGTKDTGYTGEFGLQELVKRSEDLMERASIVKERELMNRFLSALQKEGKVVYGFNEVNKALDMGAVDTLLISEGFDWVHAKLKCECGFEAEKDLPKDKIDVQYCDDCGKQMKIVESKELVDALVEKAKSLGTSVEFISIDTGEGVQFKELGGIGAFLRYKIS